MLKKKFVALITAAIMVMTSMSLINAEPVYEYGDVNMNGSITSDDAALALAYSLDSQQTVLNEQQIKLADVDGEAGITASDAACILQKVLGEITLPVGKDDETTTVETTTAETTIESTETTTETTTVETTEITTVETTTVETTETTTEQTTAEVTYAYYDFVAEDLTNEQTGLINNTTIIGAYTILPSYKVGQTTAETDSRTYNQHLQLNGTGNNYAACVYFDAPCSGRLYIVARSSNATQERSLVLANDSGTVQTISMPTAANAPVAETVMIPSNGRYYIYGGMGNINIYRLTFTGTGEIVSETTTESTTRTTTSETTTESTTFSGDTSDGVVVDNFDDLKTELAKTNNKIYIKGTIECSANIKLSTSNANVEIYGLPNADGTAATLDFAKLRDSRTSAGSGGTGFTISGSHYTFKNVIIQNAGDCGVRITGNNNTFEYCIFRYNNNSGVSITKGGAYNTFRYVDSYRNGDLVQKNGADADGFSVKLAAGTDNKFYNCRAWENSDDGWDSYDRVSEGGYIGDVYYMECIT